MHVCYACKCLAGPIVTVRGDYPALNHPKSLRRWIKIHGHVRRPFIAGVLRITLCWLGERQGFTEISGKQEYGTEPSSGGESRVRLEAIHNTTAPTLFNQAAESLVHSLPSVIADFSPDWACSLARILANHHSRRP